MSISQLHDLGLINDDIYIIIRGQDFQILVCGHWYDDDVYELYHFPFPSFYWQDDGLVYFDKEV